MSPVSSVTSPLAILYARIASPKTDPSVLSDAGKIGGAAAAPGGDAFSKVFDQLVSTVESKQDQATAITRNVLVGNQGQLHQSVIAMQEASVAFSLMVEVRNKMVDSYQELMRMPV